MNHSDIEHMAQGYPPSHIGKDYEEVVIWLATQLLATQHQRDTLTAKGMELAREAAHVYEKYNVTQMPDMDLVDGQTIQEFYDLVNGMTSTEAFLNSVRADAIDSAAEKAGEFANKCKVGSSTWHKWKSVVMFLVGESHALREAGIQIEGEE